MSDPAAPALDYAPRRPARRRWARRLLRCWPAWLLLLIVGGPGIVYGPGAWRHYRLMRLQEACMAAAMPGDRPVYEEDAAAAAALVAARPGEYRADQDGYASRVDPRWAALAPALGVRPLPSLGTAFCHERYTPDGRRRLAVVEGWDIVTVVEPGAWLGRRVARELYRATAAIGDARSFEALKVVGRSPGPNRVAAGVPDPTDRSRWVVPFVWGGGAGTFEYRLGDDDGVTIRLLEADGIKARAAAARAAAATRPTR